MMADHQTTGGYTRIANVISCDLPKLAQSAPGTRVKFTSVRVDAAQRELVGTIRQFNEIRSLVNRIVKG
jgi:Allophanate hydrolase subunit 2